VKIWEKEMEQTDPKSHLKILKDANDFIMQNSEEFEATCAELANVINGKSQSIGILCLQTVLGSLLASDRADKEELFYRVMVLIYAQINDEEGGNFNLIDKEMLN
jgi:hypothetical protein